jgi:hypothetical protein
VEHVKFSPAPEYLAKLQDTIRQEHGCEATHEGTWMGVEHWGGTLWSGSVEVFRLGKGAPAAQAFAWGRIESDQLRCYVVLGRDGINSARKAVRQVLRSSGMEEQESIAA